MDDNAYYENDTFDVSRFTDNDGKVDNTGKEIDVNALTAELSLAASDPEEMEEKSRFERNKLVVCGLSESTTNDAVVNFIEAMSGEEVKEVVKLRNGNARVTMVDDITDFNKVKTKGERTGLDCAKVSIEQVPVCTCIIVNGISDDTTHDAIKLNFESPRNSGGPVETVHFVPKSGLAVVVFQDPRDMERVLAKQEEKPHVLNKAQLSIRKYHECLENEDGDVPDDSERLGANAGGVDKAQVSQQSEAKTQRQHIVVDPDVMEFFTTTALCDQLTNSLAVKKSEIIWKPNSKMAIVVNRREDGNDSWQSECIDEVQNYLGKFTKCDVQVNKDFWEAVVAQLSSIRACLGVDPPLVKTIDDSFVARIVSLRTDVKDYEEKLKATLEEIYREETRKTYVKKTVLNVPEERLILLKKIKFVEKLQEKNKELEIKLDIEGEEIYFEGPQPQFTEATMKFYKQMSDMVEKKLALSEGILQVLRSDKGLQKVKRELETNNVEVVFVSGNDARIIGTSAAHADSGTSHVNKLVLEEKVKVDDKSKYLLKTPEWRQLCDEINEETDVHVHRNKWNDTYVAGFRDDVTEVMKKLNTFLESTQAASEDSASSESDPDVSADHGEAAVSGVDGSVSVMRQVRKRSRNTGNIKTEKHKHASTAAFKQEKSGPLGRLRRSFRSKLRGRAAESTKLPSDEVLQGKDMNIEQSGMEKKDGRRKKMDSTKMTMKEAERAKCNKTGERKATDPPKVIPNRSRLHEHDGECRVSRVPPPRPKYPPSATPLPPALHPLPPPHVQPAPPPALPHAQPASPPATPHAQLASPPAPQHVPPSPVQRPLHTPPPPPNAQPPPLPPPEDPREAEPTSSFLSPVFNQVAAFAGWLFEAEVVAGDSNTSPVLSPGNRARNHFEEQERENLLPKNWVPMPRDDRGNDVTVHLLNLPRLSVEYQDVEKRFLKTVSVEKIVSIERIQNPFLYQAYQLRKQKMDKDNGGNNERQLFHGTHPDNVTEINNQGFDRSFVGSAHGARYGAGVYFARDASYSICYTDSSRPVIYLTRVLVGKYCKGRENMRKPPAINPEKPEILFDSMVDDEQDPSVFVVYYDNQCYPEYLIKFLKY